jgi:hypothetical protein
MTMCPSLVGDENDVHGDCPQQSSIDGRLSRKSLRGRGSVVCPIMLNAVENIATAFKELLKHFGTSSS